jgi:KAP family P-loop domain
MDAFEPLLKGDRALANASEDRLGFREVAQRIASSLVDHASDNGLVIGLEGAWGSGKSSLVRLIEDELGKRDPKPSVIKFQPWLLGNRDALLSYLFAAFNSEISQVELRAENATGVTVEKVKQAREKLQKFMGAVSKFGGPLELAGEATGMFWLKWFGRFLKSFAMGKKPSEPLDKLKDELVESLKELGHRFIVIIDDVDRLEPSEVIEVLRLTRSVADFPNVIYLLCYDSEILASSIERAAGVKDGKAYLEKIVQLTVPVPTSEAFQLCNWFAGELAKFAMPKNKDEQARLRTVIYLTGERYISTPRAVVRALDSLRFSWPTLRDAEGDLADLVWVHLIKNGNPKLYRWIEKYCATSAAISLGIARVGDEEKELLLKDLAEITGPDYFREENRFQTLEMHLLGLDWSEQTVPPFKLHDEVSSESVNEKIEARRLASPDHYRLYFALSNSSHALTKQDYDDFWAAVKASADEVGKLLLNWSRITAISNLSKLEILLQRLSGMDVKILTPEISKNMLHAFSNFMDEMKISTDIEPLLHKLFRNLDKNCRGNFFTEIFQNGIAIGWLTLLFRSDRFGQSRFNSNRIRDKSEWLCTSEELDSVAAIMTKRYQNMSFDEILSTPSPWNVIFAWQQGGDEAGACAFIDNNITSDEHFIRLVESDTVYTGARISLSSFRLFIPREDIVNRLKNLANGIDSSLALRAKAILANLA